MKIDFNEPKSVTKAEYFVIVVTVRREIPGKRNEYEDEHLFFKSERYSVYQGNLQLECGVEFAHQWKTEEGVQQALERLNKKGRFKPSNNSSPVKYTQTVTERYDVVC